MTRFNAVSCFLIAAIFFLSMSVAAARGGSSETRIVAAGVVGPSPVAASSPVRGVQPPTPVVVLEHYGRRSAPHRTTHTTRLLDTTAYCATGNRTASGVWPQVGQAASNLFPFGQRLRVPGIGVVTITDRIGWGSQLDIYMGGPGCEQRALTFGRRSLLVEVLP